ncbi:MAG: polyvinylalcohol dehydrogenase, partial [Verrucomicrobiota bacterium]
AVIPTPIFENGHVYITAGYGVGCTLVKLNDSPSPEKIYFNKEMVNHHGGVIKVGDYLYGHSDGAGWVCQDFKTGELKWNEKQSLRKGAIGYADGMLYCLEENRGLVVLAEASPEGWKERGRFKLEPQSEIRAPKGKIWVHPVILNGKLYLRDQEMIFCFNVKA